MKSISPLPNILRVFLLLSLIGGGDRMLLASPNDPLSTIVPNSSNRHSFSLFTLKGRCINQQTGLPVGEARVVVTNINNDFTKVVYTDKSGNFSLRITEESIYSIVSSKESFFDSDINNASTIGLESESEIETTLMMKEVVVGKPYRLEGVIFDLNFTQVDEKDRIELDRLYRLLKANPSLQIEVACHTDARGDDQYNLVLSQTRAQNIQQYLVGKGINVTRIIAKGYGETQLLNHCGNGIKCAAQEHLTNRRTEFTILSK